MRVLMEITSQRDLPRERGWLINSMVVGVGRFNNRPESIDSEYDNFWVKYANKYGNTSVYQLHTILYDKKIIVLYVYMNKGCLLKTWKLNEGEWHPPKLFFFQNGLLSELGTLIQLK